MVAEKEILPGHDCALEGVRRQNILHIVKGDERDWYSEWMLRGTLGEPFEPTCILAVFPTLEGSHELFLLALTADGVRPAIEYWRDVAALDLPERVLVLETFDYAVYGDIPGQGQTILDEMSTQVLAPGLPSTMVLFNKPKNGELESAYLLAPTLVPPSVALKQITELAKVHLSYLV